MQRAETKLQGPGARFAEAKAEIKFSHAGKRCEICKQPMRAFTAASDWRSRRYHRVCVPHVPLTEALGMTREQIDQDIFDWVYGGGMSHG